MEKCKICSEENYYKVNFNNLYLRTDSYNKNLHSYESRVCANCGVVYQFPQVTEESIADYYKKNMRKTKFPIYFDKENFILESCDWIILSVPIDQTLSVELYRRLRDRSRSSFQHMRLLSLVGKTIS